MESDKPSGCWSALYPGLGNAESLGNDLRQKFEPLAALKPYVSRVVNFGCWPNGGGLEPFALSWILDASEVVVVEKQDEHVRLARKKAEELIKRVPCCFESHNIVFLPPRDMTGPIPELPQNYFDLSYCERVLLQVFEEQGEHALARAIAQMAQAVKPGGWVIACEQPTDYLPKDTERLFQEAGLTMDRHVKRQGKMRYAYIYCKTGE